MYDTNMCFSGKPWCGSGQLTIDKHARDVEQLDKYAQERWEVNTTSFAFPVQKLVKQYYIGAFLVYFALYGRLKRRLEWNF